MCNYLYFVSSQGMSNVTVATKNIDVSNVIWLNHEKTTWVDSNSKGEISFLLDNKEYRYSDLAYYIIKDIIENLIVSVTVLYDAFRKSFISNL